MGVENGFGGGGDNMADIAVRTDGDQSGEDCGGGDHGTGSVDPFRVRLNFTVFDWVKMAAVLVFLVPLRVVMAFICMVLAWAVSCIGLMGLDQTKPVQGWRKYLQRCSCFLGQMCVRCTGFHRIKILGKRATKDVAPILVVAPHSSFFDAFAIFWTGLPFFVNREENKNLLFIGKCIQFAQAIFVSREDPSSRKKTVDQITNRVQSQEPWEQFLIFPEGTTSNRKALMTFKPGGFLPGKTIQPVLIRYKNKNDTVTWSWDQPHGFILCFIYTICQLHNMAELEFLDPYTPSVEEVNNPKLFAQNVRKVMADSLGVPLCDMSFEDIKAKYSKKKATKGE